MKEIVYIFENKEANRVKIGVTINTYHERLKSVNDMWMHFKATCQICGGRRLTSLGDRRMPVHTTSGAHESHNFKCPGSLKPPLEMDVTVAEAYLIDLKNKHIRSNSTEKGSLTRMIKTLEKRISRFRNLQYPVGKWHVAVVYYTEKHYDVEALAHKILERYLDNQTSFGEVFCCSVQEAANAVEQALGILCLLDTAIKEAYV